MSTPKQAGFRQPGEWTLHAACWVAFPSDPGLWPDLTAAQTSFAQMCRAIARPEPGALGERLEMLVQSEAAQARAEALLEGLPVRFHRMAFGDIWMRDTAPVFLSDGERVGSVRFRFNGWGRKYMYPGDAEVAERVQALTGLPAFESALVLEGGAVESDGAGLCMTTRDVALNLNRNPELHHAEAELAVCEALGADRVVWLSQGLRNDHTDGHIDNIARFIAPGRVVCMRSEASDDPNRAVLAEIARELAAHGLEVVTIPSPGRVEGRDGRPLPASYLNFYIANQSVVVPVFGSRQDDAALRELEGLFPGRRVMPVSAKVFLEEGGTVHCITQQQPTR